MCLNISKFAVDYQEIEASAKAFNQVIDDKVNGLRKGGGLRTIFRQL